MAISGTIAVIIAAFIVKSLPLDILRWVVLAVIIITSIIMLRAAFKNDQPKTEESKVIKTGNK